MKQVNICMTNLPEDRVLTGVPQFDDDHRRMFDAIAELELSKNTEHSKILMEKMIGEWVYHMMAEETFMIKIGFPAEELVHHKTDHSRFLDYLKRLKYALNNGSIEITSDMLRHIRGITLTHIVLDDTDYGKFYKKIQSQKSVD